MKTVLITGASSGIGYQFAETFMLQGYDLFLVSKNEQRLSKATQELKKNAIGNIQAICIDLTNSGSAEKIFEIVTKKYKKKIDILVNNAGIGSFKEFTRLTSSQVDEILNLNMMAVVKLTHYFVKTMKPGSVVVNVASVLSYLPVGYAALYSSTKAFVLNFTEALAEELKSKDIQVLALCPGTTRTNFFERANTKRNLDPKANRFGLVMEPLDVVHAAIKALEKREVVEVPGFFNKLIVFFLNNLVSRKQLRKIGLKFGKNNI